MSQNYGVLRVVRVKPGRPPASTAQTSSRQTTGWLPEEGLVHVISRENTTIGRALHNDIILMDPTVSREHARLILDQSGWHLINLTAKNVVRVNGRNLPPGSNMPVHPQDIIVLGSTMLQLIAPQKPDLSNLSLANGSVSRTSVTPVSLTNQPALTMMQQRPVLSPPEPDQEIPVWEENEEESVLGAGITMQFALPQRMGTRTRWLIAGIGIAILAISTMITILLNSVIGMSALAQNGASSIVAALTIPLIPAIGINLLVNFMDRFEREPWFLRLAAFLWGALIAIPPALFIEQRIDSVLQNIFDPNNTSEVLRIAFQGLNAGVTEETIKGLGLLLLFVILRDEFDNVTDGIVYGALIGAGFAMVENFSYFAQNSKNFLVFLIVGRIILGWLGHSTFIACFGAALGYIRHTRVRWKQIVIPLIGFLIAVVLHSFFDFVDFQASNAIRNSGGNPAVINFALIAIIGNYIPPFLAQLGLLYILIKSLAHEAAVIREFLAVEVSNGIVTVGEYALLQNSFQRTKAERRVLRKYGFRQWLRVKALYQTEIGLAFRKWHVTMGDKPKLGYVQPEDAYRQRIRRLRNELRLHEAKLAGSMARA
ncbi:MAG TPA: PrsW family glutamic-type intramembrane protease [Ktedonobacteraceae bacterium]|jgi:RsiW-degrading membrane proteinase PrsW (M82 family)|nr:PrsW family glutamic-type intramembrane protease [Ktedonobacteraceae bacterium]